jgi:catechol 1,2-dioxygenase
VRAASVAGYVSLTLLALFLVGCGGGDAEQPVAELTEAGEEASTSTASSESSPDSPAETATSTAAAAEPPTGEETPPAVQAAQQVVDQTAGIDAREAYTRALRAARSVGEHAGCEPTQPDMLGPFYKPGAPERTSVGSGYVLSGAVLAADTCEPICDARIEFWLVNPRGVYDDAHRATVPAGDEGEYRFESNVPAPYENRPPHIHLRVTAPGYRDLVTQHYPEAGQTEASFDLVLEPA